MNIFDREPKKLKEIMEKEKITWRSIASQAVTTRWNAGTPTYYVLDGKGIIRYKWVGSPGEKAIDTALEKLLHEAVNNTKKRPQRRRRPKPRDKAASDPPNSAPRRQKAQ